MQGCGELNGITFPSAWLSAALTEWALHHLSIFSPNPATSDGTDVPYGGQAHCLWLTTFCSFLTRGLAGTFNFPPTPSQITSQPSSTKMCPKCKYQPKLGETFGEQNQSLLLNHHCASFPIPSPLHICGSGGLFHRRKKSF